MKNKIIYLFILLTLSAGLKAQTGGPGQPEFMNFKPVTATDLVNPSNGSFSYNIPLFDVGGYPVNLSYQSGVQMEDVASIVGLGWNINIGAVIHTIRGLPDDFNGDLVKRTIYMKPNITYGGNVDLGVEYAGFPIGGGLNAGFGIFYNNYNGYGVEESLGLNFSISNRGNTEKTAIGLGMQANSESGVDIYAQPTVSMQLGSSGDLAANGSLGGLISVNSREGLKSSINASMDLSGNVNYSISKTVENTATGLEYFQLVDKKMSEQLKSASASYSFSKTPEIPRVLYPFVTNSFTGSFKAGGEVLSLFPNGEMKGYYTSQSLSTNTVYSPAYGYLYADQAPAGNDNILQDFNREKDQPYIKDASINIGIPYYTNDIYSVNAQGIAGSFQINRDDIGVIFDNKVNSGGSALNIGFEAGFGDAFHAGADISSTNISSSSGKWYSTIVQYIPFKPGAPNELYESAYFKNASDVSVDENDFFNKLQGDRAIEVKIPYTSSWETNVNTGTEFVDNSGNSVQVNSNDYFKYKRDPRTINIQYKTATLASKFGLDKTIDSYPVNDFACDNKIQKLDRVNNFRKDYHISEITATNTDGMRYVFGLPVYNHVQKEVSFTLDKTQLPDASGLVTYNSNASWGDNGRDGFYESTELPPYVTSHLLTAVLSPDYIDVDNNGPSINDAGNYVKINYSYAGIYRWRTPFGNDKASYNRALLSDDMDNKGSYVYGEKELWYTHSMESKTEIAEFYYDTTGRKDGLGVKNEDGMKDLNQKLYKLDSIKVYSINERVLKGNQATPIRIIYFTYNYELCPGINNSSSGEGKLTLKKVSFASGKSQRELLSPYVFNYGMTPSGDVVNPTYGAMDVNRWGNYQKNIGALNSPVSAPLSNIDFPYSSQDENMMTKNSYAWNLTGIRLPSGGNIRVNYEPHSYAYTQDKRCMEMLPMEATGNDFNSINSNSTGGNWVKFKLTQPLTGPDANAQLLYRYFNNDLNQFYYYKALVTLRPGYLEWINGYFKIKQVLLLDPLHAGIELESVCRDDKDCNVTVNPILKNAWQFMRMNRPELCYGPSTPVNGNLEQFLNMPDLLSKVNDQENAFFSGFNNYAQQKQFAATLDPARSFIRLFSPYKNKIIGGSRVQRITTDDNWKQETGNAGESKTYTIDYEYIDVEKNPVNEKPDTVSTGVMEYEPFNGEDENPMRQPVYIDQHIKMAPDNHLYVETPFNESLFPAPNLVYSRVRITSNKTDLHVPGTGYREMEYYTAKDYPVTTDLTSLWSTEKKTNFLAAFAMSVLGLSEFHDYVTLSQGASITLNDMHGKSKAISNYNSKGALISSQQFEYSIGKTLNLINHNDSVYQSDKLGISASAICDSRETEHSTEITGVNLNLDVAFALFFPIIIFNPLPNMSVENTMLNSVALNKIIIKKGILTKKTVTENGSTVRTENILFDDKTGYVALSKTTNEFNDSLFKFHYPADWIYSGLSAGYKSSDLEFTLVSSMSNNYFTVKSNVFAALAIGDEIVITALNQRYWIMDKISPDIIRLEPDIPGSVVSLSATDICRVLRPGRRNQLMQEAGSVVTLVNPINGNHIDFSEINSNAKVLNTSMQEFADKRVRYCDCDTSGRYPVNNLRSSAAANNPVNNFGNSAAEINPYLTGEKGNWYPKTNWLYLTDRERSFGVTPLQTNIRMDGAFVDYKNFWKYITGVNAGWQRHTAGWQWTETITKKDVNGLTLETCDVLGRHKALMTGYNNKLVVAEVGNAQINEILFDSFEDWNYFPISGNCDNTNICVPKPLDLNMIFVLDSTESHSGKYSGKLKSSGNSISFPVIQPTQSVKPDDSTSHDTTHVIPQVKCVGKFELFTNKKYVISAWVHDAADPLAINFDDPATKAGTLTFHTSGNIIDGWQRIYGEFTTPAAPSVMSLIFIKGAGETWFDDIRIFPFDANMVTYVYDQSTQKLTFTLDDNNYFTKYNYDASDNLESINKETEKGVQTIKESHSATAKLP